MKSCPRCGRNYTDDLAFCLEDGSVLAQIYDQTETPTVVRPPTTSAPTTARGSPVVKFIGIALVGLIALGLAGAVGAYVVWTWLAAEDQTADRTTADATPTASPARRTPQTPSPSVKEEVKKRQAEALPEPPDTTPPEQFNDPGTSRINFRRGRISEIVVGQIDRERNFVLRTRARQQLSSTVTSEDGCVVFSDGGTETSFPTPSGDASISLRNRCQAPAAFRLTVTVR